MGKKRDYAVQSQRSDIDYGLYRIIAGEQAKSFKAIAYVGMRKIAETTGDNADAAINSLKAFLDVRAAKRKQERETGVPSSAEFKEALEALRPSMPQQLIDILFTHRRLPDDTAAMLQLVRISSAWTPAVMEVEYARLGRKISRLLEFSPLANGIEPQLMPIVVLATPKGSVHTRTWKLRPQVAAALDELKSRNLVKRPNGAAASVGTIPA
jgi:hypothetical protein